MSVHSATILLFLDGSPIENSVLVQNRLKMSETLSPLVALDDYRLLGNSGLRVPPV